MKGFIKIFEAIIASLILLVSLTFFFVPLTKPSPWDETLLQISTQDALGALYASGNLTAYVMKDDYPAFNLKMFNLLPRTVDFYAEINGIPKPTIRIACICTAADLASFKSKIPKPDFFTYKERTIVIHYRSMSDISEVQDNEDIILYLAHTPELTAQKNLIIDQLRKGRGVMVVSDLTKNQAEDGLMNDVFNLSWNSALGSKGAAVIDYADVKAIPFRLSKYYFNLTNSNSLLYKVPASTDSISIDGKTSSKDNNNFVSFMKINNFLKGRTVWSANADNDDAYLLIKSSFMWVSGERYVFGEKKTTPPNVKTFKFVVYDRDPYEMILHVWRVFL